MVPEVMASNGKLLEAFRTGKGFNYDGMGDESFVCATCRHDFPP